MPAVENGNLAKIIKHLGSKKSVISLEEGYEISTHVSK